MGPYREIPERFATPPVEPEAKKEEPVRTSSGVSIVAAALLIVLNQFGVTGFTAEEATIIVGAIFILANEVARLKVWAAYKP